MIIVFANEHDQYAKDLTRRWVDRKALLMTPSDLSRTGWKCYSHDPSSSNFVVGGVIYNASDIDGILVRSTMILESDLSHIASTDRGYVATEISAFLIYWLSMLGGLVLNRPTPRSLSGPGWFPEHWVHCAASVGLRVWQKEHTVSMDCGSPAASSQYTGPYMNLIIFGERCFGEAHPDLSRKAHALAQAAGVELVSFQFTGPTADAYFLGADPFPTLDNEFVELAVVNRLELGRRKAVWPGG